MIVHVIKNHIINCVKKCAYTVEHNILNKKCHEELNRDVARSFSCLVIGGEGEGVAEYATECHFFNFMETF